MAPKPPPPPAPANRKKLGILLLFIVIVLWVAGTFLTYAIFSDGSYAKPYFVTYVNSCTFCLYLLPWAVREGWSWSRSWSGSRGGRRRMGSSEYVSVANSLPEEGEEEEDKKVHIENDKLSTRQTMTLSLHFCVLWFVANYLFSSCLQWTSVASATILSSTSSIFTLLLATVMRIERFTWTKFMSVLFSLAGVCLVSSVDLTPPPTAAAAAAAANDDDKSGREALLGDAMALAGALAFGVYTVLLKVRVGREDRVEMPRFFGFVGAFNLLGLWPGLVVLDYAGVERFRLPEDARVWWIVGVNAVLSLVADYCWVHAMLLTTPLVVTVGLSLTIPLALLGQMAILGVWSGALYWVGALLVFVSFLFVNWESEVVAQEPVVGRGRGGTAVEEYGMEELG